MHATLEKFGYPELVIYDYEHWAVVLRFNHVTPGSLVIVAKADVPELGQLSAAAWAEFAQASADSETLLKKTFGAEKFNYLALMMKDPHVHFHMIPRYSKPVTVNGKEFIDTDWPLKTELVTGDYTKEDLAEIKQRLEANK